MNEVYRARAIWHLQLAEHEADLEKRTEHLKLAMSYVRLAELADKNSTTDVVYETPPVRPLPDKPDRQEETDE